MSVLPLLLLPVFLASSALASPSVESKSESVAWLRAHLDSAKAPPCNAWAGMEMPVASLPWFTGKRLNQLYVSVNGGNAKTRSGLMLTMNNTSKDIYYTCLFKDYGGGNFWCSFENHFVALNRSTGHAMGIAPALDWAHVVSIGLVVAADAGTYDCSGGDFSLAFKMISKDANGNATLLGGKEGWHFGEWKTVSDALQGGDSTASLAAGNGPMTLRTFGTSTVSTAARFPPSGKRHYEKPRATNPHCLSDEAEFVSYPGNKWQWCAPTCHDLICPTDLPPSTKIKPQCFQQDRANYCLLPCTSSDSCPLGAKCVAAVPGGGGSFCVYPTGSDSVNNTSAVSVLGPISI